MTKKLSSYLKILENQENLKMAKNKLPVKIKKLKGTLRKHREVKNEISSHCIPRKPANLSKGATRYWNTLCNRLSIIGSIDVVDDIAISILAESLAEYEEMTRFLSENGRVYEFKNHKNEISLRTRPEIKIQSDLWNRIFQLFREYGLTHKSRNNITPNPLIQTENVWTNLRK